MRVNGLQFFWRNKPKMLVLIFVLTLGILGILIVTSIFGSFAETRNAIFQYYPGRDWTSMVVYDSQIDTLELINQVEQYADSVINTSISVLNYPLFTIANANIRLYGVGEEDIERFRAHFNLQLIEGEWFEGGTNQIVVPQSFLKARNLKIGDKVGQGIDPKDRDTAGTYEITGIIDGECWFLVGSKEYMSTQKNVSTLLIVFPTDQEAHQRQINDLRKIKGLSIITITDALNRMKESSKEYNGIYYGFSFLFSVVTAIATSLFILIFYRSRSVEFAVKNIFGYSKGEILRGIIFELSIILIIGWILAIGMGYLLLRVLVIYVFAPKGLLLDNSPMTIGLTILVPLIVGLSITASMWLNMKKSDMLNMVLSDGEKS